MSVIIDFADYIS